MFTIAFPILIVLAVVGALTHLEKRAAARRLRPVPVRRDQRSRPRR